MIEIEPLAPGEVARLVQTVDGLRAVRCTVHTIAGVAVIVHETLGENLRPDFTCSCHATGYVVAYGNTAAEALASARANLTAPEIRKLYEERTAPLDRINPPL